METVQVDAAMLKTIAKSCACGHIRKAARVITQFYDAFLEPTGLHITQVTVLIAIQLAEQETVMRLAEQLAMDRSAMARTLKPLQQQGLVTVAPGSDRRTRWARVTDKGRLALSQAIPCWHKAQEQVVAYLGEEQARLLLVDLKKIEHMGL